MEHSNYGEHLQQPERVNRQRAETDVFPENIIEYQNLAPVDRLEMARRMLSCHADVTHQPTPDIPTVLEGWVMTTSAPDDSEISTDTFVGYRHGEVAIQLDGTPRQQYPAIIVVARDYDNASDVHSPYEYWGEVAFGPYASPDTGIWSDGPHFKLLYGQSSYELSDPRAQDVLAAIDRAAYSLLDGVIRHQRSTET